MASLVKTLKGVARGALDAYSRRRRAAALEKTEPHVTKRQIVAGLRDMGIAAGDVLFIHSSLKSIGFVEGGPATLIAALQEAVSPGGTLVLPTYYQPGGTILTTCQMKDYVFDPRRHGSNLGALPEAFLKVSGIKRSIHPTHSVSAVGEKADFIVKDHHLSPSIFGKGSPWDRLIALDGKVLGIGISMGPVTFYHALEDAMGADFPVPVWLDTEYRMPCRDWDGNLITVPVRPLDPKLLPVRIDNKARKDLRDCFWNEFDKARLLHTGQVGAAKSWFVRAPQFFDQIKAMAGRGLTVYTAPEELAAIPRDEG